MEVASERASRKETAMSRFLRKSVLGLVVGLSLVTPLASAAQRPQEVRTASAKLSLPTPSEMVARARRFLVRIWMKEGCRIDPHGMCLPEQGTGTGSASPDNG